MGNSHALQRGGLQWRNLLPKAGHLQREPRRTCQVVLRSDLRIEKLHRYWWHSRLLVTLVYGTPFCVYRQVSILFRLHITSTPMSRSNVRVLPYSWTCLAGRHNEVTLRSPGRKWRKYEALRHRREEKKGYRMLFYLLKRTDEHCACAGCDGSWMVTSWVF